MMMPSGDYLFKMSKRQIQLHNYIQKFSLQRILRYEKAAFSGNTQNKFPFIDK